MKSISLILSLLFIQSTFSLSDEPMNSFEQEKKIEEIAKNLRQIQWQNGFSDVESYFQKMSFTELNAYLEKDYEQNLSLTEVKKLYQCKHSPICELYFISVSSEYYGGYGQEGNFILLYTSSRKYWNISHSMYAE